MAQDKIFLAGKLEEYRDAFRQAGPAMPLGSPSSLLLVKVKVHMRSPCAALHAVPPSVPNLRIGTTGGSCSALVWPCLQRFPGQTLAAVRHNDTSTISASGQSCLCLTAVPHSACQLDLVRHRAGRWMPAATAPSAPPSCSSCLRSSATPSRETAVHAAPPCRLGWLLPGRPQAHARLAGALAVTRAQDTTRSPACCASAGRMPCGLLLPCLVACGRHRLLLDLCSILLRLLPALVWLRFSCPLLCFSSSQLHCFSSSLLLPRQV